MLARGAANLPPLFLRFLLTNGNTWGILIIVRGAREHPEGREGQTMYKQMQGHEYKLITKDGKSQNFFWDFDAASKALKANGSSALYVMDAMGDVVTVIR